jgi:kinesin family protein 3/17
LKFKFSFLETEREAMLRQLEEQKHEIEREQEERRKMQHKIQEMQSKLITGGKDIITHTSEQEQILRQKRLVRFLIVFDLLFELFFKDV